MNQIESVLEQIKDLFEKKGDSLYGGEDVTQLEHALQAAALAEQDNAQPSLVAAALLHDIGHLLHNLPDDAPEEGHDDLHEELGYRWLCRHFDDEVTEPVRMHVAAKRYLCAIDDSYRKGLSEPSKLSLELQGGPFSAEEVREFRQHPLFDECVKVRHWDDQAKVVGAQTPNLDHYLQHVRVALENSSVIQASS